MRKPFFENFISTGGIHGSGFFLVSDDDDDHFQRIFLQK